MSGDAYGRFMGRFSEPLAEEFVDWIAPRTGDRALDVGCGPGALTAVLTERLGVEQVTAVDPSQSFVRAVAGRLPGLVVRRAVAEDLPFAAGGFDLAVARLVVHFMKDPQAGVREMTRVTRPGGVVAANVWDLAGERGPVTPFWRAVREADPTHPGESGLVGVGEGSLVRLFARGGLGQVEEAELAVEGRYDSFEEWWATYELGIGPAGQFLAGLETQRQVAIRERCRASLPEAPFAVQATAWAARGRVPR